MLSELFANWLSQQNRPEILPNQTYSVVDTIDRLPSADVISILYHADSAVAMMALEELKTRFHNELNALDEMARQQQEQDNEMYWH
jgi:hypothetical protein